VSSLLIAGIGAAAAICSMSSFVPQVVKIVREHNASGVSLRTYIVTVLGFALWSTYGFMLGQWPLIASNLVSLGLSGMILVLKLASMRGRRAPRTADGDHGLVG
jgi:MtN3 and saliva related transmembrane protein